jgi:hypothetical protein
VVVEAQPGGDDGTVAQLDIVLGEQRVAVRGGLGLIPTEAGDIAAVRVEALLAQRARIVERLVQVLAAQGQHLLEAGAQRQVDLGVGAGVAQARHERPGTLARRALGAAGQTLVEAPVARVVVAQRGLGAAPVEIALVGQRVVAALHHVGFMAVQAVDELGVATAVVVHRVASVDVALAAVAGFQVEALLGAQLPAEQRVDVLVAHALAPGNQGILAGLTRGVDVGIVGVGGAGATVKAEGERLAERAAEAEVGALAHALGIVFRQRGVGGNGAAELVARALGDDVDHPAHGSRAIARGGRATQDLDALDLLGRHPVGLATGIAVAVPAIAHGIARGGRLAVDQDQGVFRPHAAQVDLAVVAAIAAGAVAGQVDPRLAADDLRQVVGRRQLADVLGGDDGNARRLLQLLLGSSQHLGFLQQHGLLGRRRGIRRSLQRGGRGGQQGQGQVTQGESRGHRSIS